MSNKKILLIAGTRPNFIKLAPLYHSLKKHAFYQPFVCHTGQHYDKNMSGVFLESLRLPSPDFTLNVSGGNVPNIIGRTTTGLAELMSTEHFDFVIIFGDVNATAAGAITAVQLGIPVMHVEAGLRSLDRSMPEEVNRVITDHIVNYLAVSEPSGISNLRYEGIEDSKVRMIGNIMIETMLTYKKDWENATLDELPKELLAKPYILSTFHRPENVDKPSELKRVVELLEQLATVHPVLIPIHPRTANQLKSIDGLHERIEQNERIYTLPPLGYFQFVKLTSQAAFVVTDSGGIQEETTFLDIPCITVRKNTERPVTITEGTNRLMKLHDKQFLNNVLAHIEYVRKTTREPIPYWDAKVSQRIIEWMEELAV